MLLGKKAHAQWHFADASRPRPSALTMRIMRGENPAWFEVLAFRLELSPLRPFMRLLALAYEFEAWTELPHTMRDVALFLPRLALALGRCVLRRPAAEKDDWATEEDEGSEASPEMMARRDRLRKRLCATAGLVGVYLVWIIFSWYGI